MICWGDWTGDPLHASEFAEACGITSIDVKKVRYAWNYDLVEIQTWNRRTIQISGMDIARALSTRKRAKVRAERSTPTSALLGAGGV